MRHPLLLFITLTTLGAAQDLRTTDGAVYRRVRVDQVERDGLIIFHEQGMAKIDLERLPPALRKLYSLNAQDAAHFRAERQAQVAREAEDNRRLIAEHEQRERTRLMALLAADSSNTLTYRDGILGDGGSAQRHFTRSLGDEIETKLATTREPPTFWNAPIWSSPIVRFIGGLLGGGVSVPLGKSLEASEPPPGFRPDRGR